MNSDGWKALIIDSVHMMERGDQGPVNDLAKLLEKTDLASQKLRDHSFGWSGLDILETVEQVIETLTSNRPLVSEIKRMELKPGDVIVLKHKEQLSDQAYENLKASMNHLFPNHEHEVIVLEEDMDIAVISRGDHGTA